VVDQELPEYARLAASMDDPWFTLLAAEQEAKRLVARGDLPRAETRLLEASATCATVHIGYRCARIAEALGRLYLATYRFAAARRTLEQAWRLARQGNEWAITQTLLTAFVDLALYAEDFRGGDLASARAYVEELLARMPDDCATRMWAYEAMANELVNQVRFDEARRELERVREGRCADTPLNLRAAFLYAHLSDAHLDDARVAGVREWLAARRADPSVGAGERALVDFIEGRLLLARDAAAGRELLGRAIAAAGALPAWDVDARQARGYATSALVEEAARRGDHAAALAQLAREASLPVPPRCAVGAAVEDAFVVVVRGPDGALDGSYAPRRPGQTIEPSTLVAPRLLARLEGCERVDAIARPPVAGQPRLLPGSLAWRYLTAVRDRAERPAPEARPAKRVVVARVEPPASLGLPPLASWRSSPSSDRGVTLVGAAATPARVLAELADATDVEIHAHGMLDAGDSDASFIALSPEQSGRWALTAADVAGVRMTGAPLVILAACEAARPAPRFHESWSLPAAFLAAGARSVIASPSPVEDVEVGPFFERVRARLAAGASVAAAVRDARLEWKRDHAGAWVDDLLVFE
jgi:hypothetical protein